MKKHGAFIRFALLAIVLSIVTTVFWGCGSDDDPVDPPAADCAISLISPNAGESFIPGDADHQTVNIRWSEEGDSPTVNIELLKGGNLVGLISSSVVNSGGFYRWVANNMGADNGDDFSIRVTANDDNTCFGTSGEFSLTSIIGCSMSITSSFVDEHEEPLVFQAGEHYELTWDHANTTGSVSIELWKQDQNLGYVTETPIANTGTFDWLIDSLHNGTYSYYVLKVRDSEVSECVAESPMFPMVDSQVCSITISNPGSDEVWIEGTSEDIDMTFSPDVSMVDLRMYVGNIYLGTIMTNVLVEDFPFTWLSVNDYGNTQGSSFYRIRAVNTEDQYCVGISEAFTIISQ
ncbi:MAG: hypothetical protein GY780_10440 [bacterium]|nr:hypothetical protein [bacterium]